ncbi:MAG: pyruvate formate lyase family protein, partial [Clostridia bacterium]|nr:pyruvate formate lyase family protein [Clostridia bacterium]
MTERTAFLREQTLSGANKCRRADLPKSWTTANEPGSLPVRKALGLKMIFDRMPLYIGPGELIVGTRTYYVQQETNPDGADVTGYDLCAFVPFARPEEIAQFGEDMSTFNKTHYTPDLSIILEKGIGGILAQAEARKQEPGLKQSNLDFLDSLIIAYTGLSDLILRYSAYAAELAQSAQDPHEKERLWEIARVCKKISREKPEQFREAVQLLWFTHLGIIIESFEFISYGRLDVILDKFLPGTPIGEARQIIECLLLKMYDQVDLRTGSLGSYAAQLVVTLGGVLPSGESAVSKTTMLFLEAIDHVRLPEPEFNLRLSQKNPPEFLDAAAKLTITGCNNVSYYNDDLFVDSLVRAGIPVEAARDYGFDLCQDINIPGRADFYVAAEIDMTSLLMQLLQQRCDFPDFDALTSAYKAVLAQNLQKQLERFNQAQENLFRYRDEDYLAYFEKAHEDPECAHWKWRSPMCPLPLLSGMFHGTLENAQDLVFEPYPIKEKGVFLQTATESINSLAAIRQVVFDQKLYTLSQVVSACQQDFCRDGQEVLRLQLWNAPKWGNDDDYVDSIAKDILESALAETEKYRTVSGGRILGGI